MKNETSAKIKALFEAILENYRLRRDPHPEVAAKFQVELFLREIKNQPEYADQLLNEEIEDTLKSRLAI